MTTKETGGPAFPFTCPPEADESILTYVGLTVRDYMAAKALEGMLCNGFIPRKFLPEGSVLQDRDFTAISYKIADAMLEARK